MTFRVQEYSLSSRVRVIQKAPVNTKAIFHTPPLVILNNFDESTSERPEMKLVRSTFQNMFPPINIATVKLAHCKRVLLYNLDKGTDEIEFRHYAITARPAGLTRSVREWEKGGTKTVLDILHRYIYTLTPSPSHNFIFLIIIFIIITITGT